MNRGLTTRSLEKIEQRMEGIEKDSLRYKLLQNAKNFKTSWIELGQALYSVWKDRLYKDWGYITFDAYASREIGIKKLTAMKLLKSYYFLEKEEPSYLKSEYAESHDAAVVPGYESINLLRLAKNKKGLDDSDYTKIKKNVFESGRDVAMLKKDLVTLMRQREELQPEEARRKRAVATLKRLLSSLRSLRREIEAAKLLPASVIKETDNLITKIEKEVV